MMGYGGGHMTELEKCMAENFITVMIKYFWNLKDVQENC